MTRGTTARRDQSLTESAPARLVAGVIHLGWQRHLSVQFARPGSMAAQRPLSTHPARACARRAAPARMPLSRAARYNALPAATQAQAPLFARFVPRAATAAERATLLAVLAMPAITAPPPQPALPTTNARLDDIVSLNPPRVAIARLDATALIPVSRTQCAAESARQGTTASRAQRPLRPFLAKLVATAPRGKQAPTARALVPPIITARREPRTPSHAALVRSARKDLPQRVPARARKAIRDPIQPALYALQTRTRILRGRQRAQRATRGPSR